MEQHHFRRGSRLFWGGWLSVAEQQYNELCVQKNVLCSKWFLNRLIREIKREFLVNDSKEKIIYSYLPYDLLNYLYMVTFKIIIPDV